MRESDWSSDVYSSDLSCLRFHIITRINDNHARNFTHQSDIFIPLMCCSIYADRNACMCCSDLDIQMSGHPGYKGALSPYWIQGLMGLNRKKGDALRWWVHRLSLIHISGFRKLKTSLTCWLFTDREPCSLCCLLYTSSPFPFRFLRHCFPFQETDS